MADAGGAWRWATPVATSRTICGARGGNATWKRNDPMVQIRSWSPTTPGSGSTAVTASHLTSTPVPVRQPVQRQVPRRVHAADQQDVPRQLPGGRRHQRRVQLPGQRHAQLGLLGPAASADEAGHPARAGSHPQASPQPPAAPANQPIPAHYRTRRGVGVIHYLAAGLTSTPKCGAASQPAWG